MKKLVFLLALVAMVVATGCSKPDGVTPEDDNSNISVTIKVTNVFDPTLPDGYTLNNDTYGVKIGTGDPDTRNWQQYIGLNLHFGEERIFTGDSAAAMIGMKYFVFTRFFIADNNGWDVSFEYTPEPNWADGYMSTVVEGLNQVDFITTWKLVAH